MAEEQTEFFNEVTDDYPTSYLPANNAPPFVITVTIQNFKRIEDARILLAKMSVLTGVNNSGKSTILQAIWVAFECLRLCVDRNSWQIARAGRALVGFEFLPANEPQDLWFGRRYRSGNSPRPIKIRIELSDGFFFETQINLYFGAINVKVTDWNRAMGADAIKKALSLAPMLIPGHVEISPHEDSKVPALIHKFAQSGQLSSIIRNVLLSLSKSGDSVAVGQEGAFQFVAEAIAKHFTLELKPVSFDPIRDLEIRAPYLENACELDIVAAGSGFHQILKLAAFISWRNAKIVLLDEPDAHLHTSLQARLSLFLSELSQRANMQIVLATHSKDLISRAPLDSVIPVNAGAREMTPISRVEHLLTEFRKLGPVGNFDLALLYQTKRCLFVEGPSDVTWLPLIAARLNSPVFTGAEQFVIFEFKGVEKFTLVKDLAELFRRVIGCSLSWFVLRDREASIPKVFDRLKADAQRRGIEHFLIWQRYSIENYLLEPSIVQKAVTREANLRGAADPGEVQITEALNAACQRIFEEVRTDYISTSQNFYIRHELVSNNPREAAIADALAYLDQCKDLAAQLRILPGYKIYGQFAQELQTKYGLALRFENLIECLDESNAPSELKELFVRLERLTEDKTS